MKVPSFRQTCDSSWNRLWSLTPALFVTSAFCLTTVITGNLCIARNTEQQDVLYETNFQSVDSGQLWHLSKEQGNIKVFTIVGDIMSRH